MSRGDGRGSEYRFADGDEESEDIGYGGGGGRKKYDDDDEDEGGWATHRETDDLWDSTEDLDEDEEAVEGATAEVVEGEEEEDAFGRAPAPRAAKTAPAPKAAVATKAPAKPAPAPKAAKKAKPAKAAKKAVKKAAKKPAKKTAKKSAKKGKPAKKKGRR